MSYFNPYKYHEHWEKTKYTNFELHNSANGAAHLMPYSPRNPTNDQKAQTDDFINTKNSHNNGSYSQNGTGNGASKFYRTNPQSEYNFQKSQSFYNYPGASFDHGHVKRPQFEQRHSNNAFALNQNQNFYQQENQQQQHLKNIRVNKQRFHYNGQNVFE